MNKKIVHSAFYKGIAYELVLWGEVKDFDEQFVQRDYNPTWNLYITIHTDQIPKKYKPKSFLLRGEPYKPGSHMIMYDYYKHPIINGIDFHGGCTYYEKRDTLIKVGCDYNHLGDHHRDFCWQGLKFDAERAIDSFLEMLPGYRQWCTGSGKLYDTHEGIFRDGRFCSKKYYGEKYPEWFKQPMDTDKGESDESSQA